MRLGVALVEVTHKVMEMETLAHLVCTHHLVPTHQLVFAHYLVSTHQLVFAHYLVFTHHLIFTHKQISTTYMPHEYFKGLFITYPKLTKSESLPGDAPS